MLHMPAGLCGSQLTSTSLPALLLCVDQHVDAVFALLLSCCEEQLLIVQEPVVSPIPTATTSAGGSPVGLDASALRRLLLAIQNALLLAWTHSDTREQSHSSINPCHLLEALLLRCSPTQRVRMVSNSVPPSTCACPMPLHPTPLSHTHSLFTPCLCI